MSKLEDVIDSLQAIIDKLDEASQTNSAGSSDTDDALNIAASVGMVSAVEGLSSLKDDFENLGNQLAGTRDNAENLLAKAHALRDGT